MTQADNSGLESAPPSVPQNRISRREFLSGAAGIVGLASLCGLPVLDLGCARKFGGRDGTIRIGLDRPVTTLDPAMHRSRTVQAVVRNIFDGLTTRTNDMRVVPQLAESWEALDELTWRFAIRKGVRFHDGSECTAEDVKFSLDRIIKPGAVGGRSSPRKGLLGPVSEIEVVGKHEALIHTKHPFPILGEMLTFQEIVPAGHVRTVGDAKFAESPMGTGPFRFVEWRKGERIVLERFDDYFGDSPEIPPVGPAKLERVVFQPIPEVATRIASLLSGEADIIQEVPPHSVDSIEGQSGAAVKACSGTRTHFVGLNCRVPPFNDRRVRLAARCAINFERIVNKVLSGYGTVLRGPLVPEAFAYHAELSGPGYNPARSRSLLRQARRLQTKVELDTENSDKELAEAIAAQFREAGFKARVRVWKWDLLQPRLAKQQRQMFLTHWGNASLDPMGILVPLFQTGERGNYFGYSRAEVDRLLLRATTSFDSDVRRDCFQRVQEILNEDIPGIFGIAKKELYGVSSRVHDWSPRPDGMLPMHDVSIS